MIAAANFTVNGHIFPELSVENAEMMEKIPWKMIIFNTKWPFNVKLAVDIYRLASLRCLCITVLGWQSLFRKIFKAAVGILSGLSKVIPQHSGLPLHIDFPSWNDCRQSSAQVSASARFGFGQRHVCGTKQGAERRARSRGAHPWSSRLRKRHHLARALPPARRIRGSSRSPAAARSSRPADSRAADARARRGGRGGAW